MNETGVGGGDIGEDFGTRARGHSIEMDDPRPWSSILSSSSKPHIVEVLVGDSGVECLRPLTFKYTVPSGGGQTPLSLGCNGFEIEAAARWLLPFRASGDRSDRCNGEMRSGPGVCPNSCVILRVFLTNPARSVEDRVVVEESSTLGLSPKDLRSEWGRLNTGLGVVGIGGFAKGLVGRE